MTEESMHRPIPVPDAMTEPFWEAVNRRRLVIQRCQSCRTYYHPPAGICQNCLSVDLQFEPVSGRGKVYTYTTTYDAREPAFEAIQPYALAVVELEEQKDLFMLSNILGTPPEDVHHGLAVEVDFQEIVPGHLIPQFRVANGGK